MKFLKYILEPLVILTQYLSQRVRQDFPSTAPTVIGLVRRNARVDSASFVAEHISEALLFDSRESLWDYALSRVSLTGHFLEFGVWKGESINYIARKNLDRTIFGFDSFEGLPEDWVGTEHQKGTFDLGGRLPVVETNVVLVPGWFEETIPTFLEANGLNTAFIHLDADTYEATQCVLSLLGPGIVPGCILVFDEHHGIPNWRNGEFRALNEFAKSNNLRFRYIGFSNMAAVIEIIS